MKTQTIEAEPLSPVFALTLPTYNLPKLPAVLTPKEFDRLEELEGEFKELQPSFERAGEILLEIRDKQLYRQDFKTFQDYCVERWNIGARRGRQLADSANVLKNLSYLDGVNGTMVPLPKNERQVRALANLPAEQQREIWTEVATKAKEEDRAPTGKDVQRAIEERKQPAFQLEPESQWPRPNEHGLYEDIGSEVFRFRHSLAKAEISVLQIGENKWVSTYRYSHETGNHDGVCAGLSSKVNYDTRSLALRCALIGLRDDNIQLINGRGIGEVSPKQKRIAQLIVKWCGTMLKEQCNENTEGKTESNPNRDESSDTPTVRTADVDPTVKKLAKKIYEIGNMAAGNPTVWPPKESTLLAMIAIARWHLGEIASLARVVDEEAELRAKEIAKRKGPAKSKTGFVFCREPMAASIAKKPRYLSDSGAGGWTNDPRKAKVFLSMVDAKKANHRKDKIIPLAKAIRRFETQRR